MKDKYIFKNREEASSTLINILPKEILQSNETVVLGISEGGVFFAKEIASFLNCRVDILLSEPIISDINPKLALAMVGETEEIIMNKSLIDSFNISEDYIYSQAHHKYKEEILRYINKYRDGLVLNGLNNKFVILVDESIETGLTIMTAIKTVIALGAKNVFVAVPILDNIIYKSLVKICDDIFCPYKINDYISKEYYYKDLEPFNFEEIEHIMQNRDKKIENRKEEI